MKPDGDPRASSLGHLVILLVAGLVMTTGLIGDIARHVLQPPDTPDGVIGGWHLVVVLGVVVAAAGLGTGYTTDGPAFLRQMALGAVGVGVSTAGLVLLLVWHRSVGVETRVRALVSPPHLVLFIGLGLVLLGPILAVARHGPRLGWTDSLLLWTPSIALLLTTNLVTGYASALAGGVDFDLGRLPPVVGESVSDLDLARGLVMILWLTATTTIAHAALLRRFRPRPGLIVVGFLALAIVPQLLDGDGGIGALSIGLVAAGVVVELAVVIHGRPTLGPVTAPMTMALMAAVLWATTFLVLDFDERLRWSMPLTLGSIMLAVLAAAGASVLVGGPSAVAVEPAVDGRDSVSATAASRRRPADTRRSASVAPTGETRDRTRRPRTTSSQARQTAAAVAAAARRDQAVDDAADLSGQHDRARRRVRTEHSTDRAPRPGTASERAATTEPTESTSPDPRPAEPIPTESKSTEPKSPDPRSTEPKSPESKPIESTSIEPIPTEPKSPDPRSPESKPIESTSLEPIPTESRSPDPRSPDQKPIEPIPTEPTSTKAQLVAAEAEQEAESGLVARTDPDLGPADVAEPADGSTEEAPAESGSRAERPISRRPDDRETDRAARSERSGETAAAESRRGDERSTGRGPTGSGPRRQRRSDDATERGTTRDVEPTGRRRAGAGADERGTTRDIERAQRARAEEESAERSRPAGSRPPGRKRAAALDDRRRGAEPRPTSSTRGDDRPSERGSGDVGAIRRRTEGPEAEPRRADTSPKRPRRDQGRRRRDQERPLSAEMRSRRDEARRRGGQERPRPDEVRPRRDEERPKPGETRPRTDEGRPTERQPVARKATKRRRDERPTEATTRGESQRVRSQRGDRATPSSRTRGEQPEAGGRRAEHARPRPAERPPRPEAVDASTPRTSGDDGSDIEQSGRRRASRPPRRTEETGRPDDSGRPERGASPERSGRPERGASPERSGRPERRGRPGPSASPDDSGRPERRASPDRGSRLADRGRRQGTGQAKDPDERRRGGGGPPDRRIEP